MNRLPEQDDKKRACRARMAPWIATVIIFGGTSCTRSVDVTEHSLAPPTKYEGLYRIETVTERFTVREFLISDSTLVIFRLSGSDKRYGTETMPIIVNVGGVRSISRLETSAPRTALALVGCVVFAAVIFVVTGSFSGLD